MILKQRQHLFSVAITKYLRPDNICRFIEFISLMEVNSRSGDTVGSAPWCYSTEGMCRREHGETERQRESTPRLIPCTTYFCGN